MRSAAETVARAARRRGVRLLHSTHLFKNLPHILAADAILTARELHRLYGSQASRFLHDPRRYEKFTVGLDYVNCSLSYPNCELLYRRSRSGWKREWVHLALSLDLLNRLDTLFCAVSAATDFGKRLQSGSEGFSAMFADEVDGHDRAGLPDSAPTHPQAEVLIRGPVALSLVDSIIVPDASVAAEVARLCEWHNRPLRMEVQAQLFVWPKWLLKKQ